MSAGSILQREIEEQPAALQNLLDHGGQEVSCAAEKIRAFDPTWVLIAARGSSDNAARYAQYLMGAHNGLGVGLALPSLCTLYNAPPRLDRALTIGISQSGQSPDVVSVLQEARNQGGATLAITNDETSPLAACAESCITLRAGPELAVAATKTYTSELLALAMLSAELEGDSLHIDELAQVPETVARCLAACPPWQELTTGFDRTERFVVLGRGLNYCTAFEIALKMKETSYVLAEAYSMADFQHGPIALVDEEVSVVLVATSGRGSAGAIKLLDQLQATGARVIGISDQPEVLERCVPLPIPTNVPEWLSPIVAVVPGQLWARGLALCRGLDPDSPRGLSKVTLTH